MNDKHDNATYGLLVSFEDQSASYVHGYEAGQLAARMKGNPDGVDLGDAQITVHAANRMTIERMCTAWGWQPRFTETEYPEWVYLTLTRVPKPTPLPNPHGLKIVN